MKKITLFLLALALVGMANAKEFRVNPQLQKSRQVVSFETKQKVETPFEMVKAKDVISEATTRRAAQAEDYADSEWAFTPGQMQQGFYEGFAAYSLEAIVLPYYGDFWWYSAFGTTDWTINGEVVAEQADSVHFDATGAMGAFDGKFLPVTSDHVVDSAYNYSTQEMQKNALIKGSSYASGAASRWFAFAPEEKYINGEDNFSMTLCAMNTDPIHGNDGSDLYMISTNPQIGKYYNGTNRILSLADPVRLDTIGIIVNNDANMMIDKIHLAIYNADKKGIETMVPDGVELKLCVFPIVDGNKINLEDTIASTVVTNQSFTNAGAAYAGTLTAKFYPYVDLDSGEPIEGPIYTGGSFYLQITNFNETGCDFGFFSDYYCPVTYTTVYQVGGEFVFLGGGGANLAIMFDGFYPTLACLDEVDELIADKDGGLAYYVDLEEGEEGEEQEVAYSTLTLLPNIGPEDWDVENDEWITVTIDDTHYYTEDYEDEFYGFVFAQFECEALPEGVDYREGRVYIYAADGGCELEFTIKQGTPPTVYTVVGGLSDEGNIDDPVFGKSWNPELSENDMTLKDGIFVWEKENLELTAGQKIMFKVVKDHAWDEAWPAENYEVSVEEDGQYKLTITFNPEDKSVNATLVNTTPVVYTVAGGLSDEGNIDDPVFGKSWNPELSDNDMVLEEDLYVWKKENLELTAGQKIQFKVVKNHSWDKAWPESNYEVSIAKDGIYALTITFKEDEEKVEAILVKVPDYPDLADGYYLVGTFNDWTPTAEDLLVLNEGAEGEYTIIVDLNEGDEFKAVRIENGDIAQWYPEGMGNNYVVDADHAGHKTVYFRPAGSEEWGGDFWIDMYEGFEQISADGKPVKVIYNGEMLIIRGDKIFNAQGATVK